MDLEVNLPETSKENHSETLSMSGLRALGGWWSAGHERGLPLRRVLGRPGPIHGREHEALCSCGAEALLSVPCRWLSSDARAF